jgi:prolyl oligopeptidase
MQNRSVATLLAGAVLCVAADDLPPIPSTPKKPVTDEYQGVQVVDDYRWLEPSTDPQVRSWSDQQNVRTRAYLDRLPNRAAIVERLDQLNANSSTTASAPSPRYSSLIFRGGMLFALKIQPPKRQPYLVTLASPDDPDSARTVVDPNILDPSGSTTIDFYVPSLDGKLVAVSLSRGGTEDGTVSVFEGATGHRLPDLVPGVNGATAGGSVAWNHDATGFWYTRYPRESERPAADLNFYQQVYFHRLGAAPSQDEYAVGKQFPRIAEVLLRSSDDGKYILARVANGDGGDFLHYMLLPDGQWHQITRFADHISQAAFGADGTLYLLSRKDAPMGKVLALAPPTFSVANAKTILTATRSSINDFVQTGKHLYVRYMSGGPSKLFDLESGKPDKPIDIPPVSSVGQLVALNSNQLLFENESFVEPSAWYLYDPANGQVKSTAMIQTALADFSDTEVIRQTAVSKDGTRVPMTILRRKGTKMDGKNPTLLTAYGGYGISQTPSFSVRRRLWLDHGGVWVVANLRGGGELGETWHEQGRLTNKQNVFDDFIACAEFLIKAKYTNPDKLVIEGRSNGGLLMGAALTQRPDLFRAVVSYVGIYDMLRVETFPNGVFNVTEFGTVKEKDQFQSLYAYSPYHRVKDGTDYPAVLFLTGANDGRVDPMNSRKMTARLQAATHSERPVLLRTSSNSGHGVGAALNERIDQDADEFSFLFDQLEMK